MRKLRSVRTEIAKMKRELEAREAEYRREALAPSMDVLAKTLLDDDEFCEVIEQYSKDEVRVIAKHIAGNMSRIIRESDADIGALREKKKERAARRKAAKESAEVTEPVRDEQVDTGACILRSRADSDAFQSGRYAEYNGRPKTLNKIA